ncbi:MAG: 5-formaminoimidazole-4-carboxamide-1-(beta)-D-ribofuranosyl 5'-monophosphate synthetase [Thermoplasmata archaeon]|nr:MAG: 5-formaminoimidazole-4-carboxamide-1-(beta)-D-ribofuranosyl 5'-monophosphate synthetase [Thermoplasmata archaeon]
MEADVRRIHRLIEEYDKEKLTITTVCSHSSLQIFHGARLEGFKTLGIALKKPPRYYDAFPLAKPDEFLTVDSYQEIFDIKDQLIEKNVILVPHGSFVEYLGADNFRSLPLPTFGNRRVLEWESDRRKQREWLTSAGVRMPREVKDPKEINFPVLVKYDGAKGGRGFFIARNYQDFLDGIDRSKGFTIQEYILGTRYYFHFFYSPIKKEGYKLSRGTLEMLSIDRRDESNIDEMYKLGSQEQLKKQGIVPTFVVTGNAPVAIRESLLPKVFDYAEKTVEKSLELFGGIIGPFCLESVVKDDLEIVVFEISARIVAGTNLFIKGSPYSDLLEENMSTGRRIAREIKLARDFGRLKDVIT